MASTGSDAPADARAPVDELAASAPASRTRNATAVVRILFPGDRRVWLWSLVALVPLLAILGYQIAKPRDYYTGTNSVGFRSIVGTLATKQRLCVPESEIPADTARVQFFYATNGPTRPPLSVTIDAGGSRIASGSLGPGAPTPLTRATIPISPAIPHTPAARVGTLCISAGAGPSINLGGAGGLRTDEAPPTLDGRPFNNNIDLWFLPKAGKQRSLISSWSSVMRRLSLFRPGFASSLFYWLLFVVGLPLLAYFSLRLLAVAAQPGRRLALGLALIAFASAGSWALTTMAFDVPDESEHYAYTESIAESGRATDATPGPRMPYATDQVYALDAIHHFQRIEFGDTRPPWFAADQQRWRARLAHAPPPRNNGGGYAGATQLHSPLYYSLLVPGYELGRSGGTFTELFWMRLTSALLAVVVVLAAFGTLRELVPSRPELAVAGGLLVALQPMFSFIGGGINNDNGVNAAAALAVYLVIRALRRGLSRALWIALGVVVAVLPIMKGTGYALYPAIVLALLALLARERSRAALSGVGLALLTFAAATGAWGLVAGDFHRAAVTTSNSSGGVALSGSVGAKLVYLWEVFLPRLGFMAQHWTPGEWPFRFIYVQRGFGAFGWYAVFFSSWVYDAIVAVMATSGLLALRMGWLLRTKVLSRWREVAFLLLVICGVIAGVEFVYYRQDPRPEYLIPEQGRYAFTAIVPLVCLALAGALGFRRRIAVPLLSILVAAMVVLAIASRVLYITATYT